MSCILQGRTGVSGPMVHIVIIVVVIIIRYHRYIQPTWRFATIMFPAQTPIFSHLTTTMIKCQSNQRWWAVSNTVLSTSLPGSVAFLEQWNRPSSLLTLYFSGGNVLYSTWKAKLRAVLFYFKTPNSCTSQKKSSTCHHPLTLYVFLSTSFMYYYYYLSTNLPWWDCETVSFDPWSKIQVPSLQLHFFALGLTMVREPPEILCFFVWKLVEPIGWWYGPQEGRWYMFGSWYLELMMQCLHWVKNNTRYR